MRLTLVHFFEDKLARGGEPANEFSRVAKLPRPGPEGPFVSPGAVMVRKLAETDPAVADSPAESRRQSVVR